MSWTLLGGSVVAVLALAGIARLLKLGEGRIEDDRAACRIAEEMLAGFEARYALISSDGGAALVAGNGTIAVLKRHGARIAARRLVPPIRMRSSPEGVAIETGERMFGRIELLGVLPEDVLRLEAPLTLV